MLHQKDKELLERDFLLNGKLLFEIDDWRDSNQIINADNGICVYVSDKESLYFAKHSTSLFAVEVLQQLARHSLRHIEGAPALIHELGSYLEDKNRPLNIKDFLLFSCQSELIASIECANFPVVSGEVLLNLPMPSGDPLGRSKS